MLERGECPCVFLKAFRTSEINEQHANRKCRLVRREVVVLIPNVSLKPDPAFASGPCRLIKGTAESQGNKQVVFKALQYNSDPARRPF